jgi:hypothetical protein
MSETENVRRSEDIQDDYAVRTLRAGLGYGPALDPKQLIEAIQEEHRTTVTVTLDIPAVLQSYFQIEAAKLGMTESELMVRILETHKFADQRMQHLTLAIERRHLDRRRRLV